MEGMAEIGGWDEDCELVDAIKVIAADIRRGEHLKFAFESAKPEPNSSAIITGSNHSEIPNSSRPGWVEGSVLRAKAEEWRPLDDNPYASDEQLARDDQRLDCARELTAIADTAGDAEAVERAAFERGIAKAIGIVDGHLAGRFYGW